MNKEDSSRTRNRAWIVVAIFVAGPGFPQRAAGVAGAPFYAPQSASSQSATAPEVDRHDDASEVEQDRQDQEQENRDREQEARDREQEKRDREQEARDREQEKRDREQERLDRLSELYELSLIHI